MTNVAEQVMAVDQLRSILNERSVIHTRQEVGRGETDHIAVYVITNRNDDAAPVITNISYYAALATGRKLRPGRRIIAVGGGQLNKGLDVADALWRVVFGVSIDQTNNWEEIS